MTKREFLEKLRQALNGRMSSGTVADNLQYYEDYINTEIRKGRTEEEVLFELGDPRLIARTIVETRGENGGAGADYTENNMWYEAQEEGDCQVYGEPEDRQGRWLTRVPVWGWLLLILVILIVALSAVFSLLAALLPVILPIVIVVLVVKAFRDWIQ